VPETDPDLPGVPLNMGLVIRRADFSTFNGKKLWSAYPKFVDYAKTYRLRRVKNADWYNDGPYH